MTVMGRGGLLAGPYLVGATPTGITIRWEYMGEVDSAVTWQSPDKIVTTVEGEMMQPFPPLVGLPGRIYEVRLADLRPCTTYRYRLEPRDRRGFPYHFRTPPEDGHRCLEGTRFVVYGGTRTRHMEHILGVLTLSNTAPHYLINLGNIIYKATRVCEWHKFFSVEKELLPLRPISMIPGIHEGYKDPPFGAAMLRRFFQDGVFGGVGHYAFTRGMVHFTMLDVYWGEELAPGHPGYEWLDRTLRSVPMGRYKFVMIHEPPMTLGPDAPFRHGKALMELFSRHRVHVVCSARSQIYEHFKVGNTHYLMLGGMGAPPQKPRATHNPEATAALVKTGAFPHFLLVEEGGMDHLLLKVVDAKEGKPLEQWKLPIDLWIPVS